ncbi:hypothetical protein ATI61_101382 [Archangium gephyra]|uniref:Lipoprotein n=2 Tax=Archangium gephyra TaxID=48 RepID=A0ABX9KC65_9BACT|nr:hypothetical protein ATI61_101382 [Archangium gephyra]
MFCDGERLSFCMRSGKDAISPEPCPTGSTNNPVSCHQDRCGFGEAACCRTQKPTCRWNLSAPVVSGESYQGGESTGTGSCSAPSSCGDFGVYMSLGSSSSDSCSPSSGGSNFNFRIERPITAGEVIPMTDPRVDMSYYKEGRSCFSWTGTITIVRDVPNWAVSMDVTCADTGKGDLQVKGDFSGDI